MIGRRFIIDHFYFQPQQQQPLLVSGGTRRQLTPAQQTHILSDIQQHQQRFATQNHLFNPNQQQKVFGQKIAHNILIEPSVQTQLPTETTVLQLQQAQNPFYVNQQLPPQIPQQQALQSRFRTPNNLRSNELHTQHHTQTNFIPNFNAPQNNVVFPQQPLFERNSQPVFQRSVANQQGDANHVFRPSQPFPAVPPAPAVIPASSDQNFGQQLIAPVQTLQQNQLQHQPPHQQPNHHPANHQQNVQNVQFVQNHVLPPVQNQQFNQFQNPQVHFNQAAPSNNAPFFGDLRPEDPRYKEFLERQKIIQKHEHFVHRNHEKQQAKVRQLHQEFVQQQRRIKEQSIVNLKQRPSNNYFPPASRGRLVSPYEIGTFERAVQSYQQNFPTQPTSTPYPVTESEAAAASTTTRVKSSRSNVKGDISEDELERLLSQQREKLYTQLKQDDKTTKKAKVKPTKAIGRDDLLKQLKLALADQPADLGNSNYTTMDLVLPDGQKVQVIRTTDPNLVKGATPLNADGTILAEPSNPVVEQKPLIEQAADSGLIPPGSDFEVIRQSTDGTLQPVGNLTPKKKVTFVYLEEQNDGSYKVQGVKSNGEKEAKTNGVEVESIINRIKNGEIQLPPTSVRRNTVAQSTASIQSSSPSSPLYSGSSTYDSSSPSTHFMTSATPSPTFSFVSSASPYSTLSTDPTEDQENLLTASPSSHYPTSTPRSVSSRSIYTTRSLSTTYSDNHIASTGQQQQTVSASTASQTPTTSPPTETLTQQQSELINILKNSGLHAMAKYLKQSGLDSILNETGPYTLFAPSDKAFKNLLVQLGGPDRAEEKFKTNPRLLSGVSDR